MIRTFSISALFLSVPASALAASAGGEHHSLFSIDFVYTVINFLIYVGLLVYLLRKPIRNFLINRREEVRSSIEEANEAKQKAEAALAEYRQKLASLDDELDTLKAEILSTGEREKENMIAAAKAQSEKLLADAKLIGDQEVRRAKRELREEMVRLAVELAEKNLVAKAGAGEREQQMNDFIAKLEAL